ncbi:phospholipid-transporting ATPase 2-like, partial [Mangifera indica]|uniref:phospholipid-transporting ATPase 2-like n=1 Tax=Mangifera indica TaxID=29780 RepID=UPI001CFA447B
ITELSTQKFIGAVQLWSLITPVNPASRWGPLIFIFAVSSSKEAWDDYNRYLSNKKANEKEIWIVKQGIKKHIQAQDIRVGNIVWLHDNDEVPCDLVLIGTSDLQGVCYAEIFVIVLLSGGVQIVKMLFLNAEFRFLKRLILVHGRYSYNRTAFLSQYSFYNSLLLCFIRSCISGTSLFNSVSLMAYNVFYASVPVLVSVLDKDLCEQTVMQHPQILFYCQAGRLLNPSTFAGWFGRSLFHAIVMFVVSINAYVYEKSEMEEVSMVALSVCLCLQAFVVALETNVPTSCHMGEFSCLLCHKLDIQCYSIIRDVHNHVPIVSPTVLLVNYVCNYHPSTFKLWKACLFI